MPLEQTRNSKIRDFFKKPVDGLAAFLVKKFPNLTADHITYTGSALVTVGALVRTISEIFEEDNALASLGLIAFGVCLDGLDGAVARQKKPNDDSSHGVIVDVLNDRAQESILALSRIVTASMRQDLLGVLTAASAGLTNPLPSLIRAIAERNGVVVAESGKNPLSFFGTRLGRTFLATTATVYPETNVPLIEEPMQPFLDGLTTFANISSTIERVVQLFKKRNEAFQLDQNSRKIADEKAKALILFSLINTTVMISAGVVGILASMRR